MEDNFDVRGEDLRQNYTKKSLTKIYHYAIKQDRAPHLVNLSLTLKNQFLFSDIIGQIYKIR